MKPWNSLPAHLTRLRTRFEMGDGSSLDTQAVGFDTQVLWAHVPQLGRQRALNAPWNDARIITVIRIFGHDDMLLGQGAAIKCPGDEYSAEAGESIAFTRALESAGLRRKATRQQHIASKQHHRARLMQQRLHRARQARFLEVMNEPFFSPIHPDDIIVEEVR